MPRARKNSTIKEDSVVTNSETNFSESKNKMCCNDCGRCENCLHPLGNLRNYTPLLILLLLVSSFLLGMFITKAGYFQSNNLSGYTMPSNTGNNAGTTQQAQAGSGTVKPLHVAQAIGMDPNQFKSCLESGKYTQQVAADLAEGQKDGVNGTPDVFVDGLSVVGAQPYNVFQQTINAELGSSRIYKKENILQRLADAFILPAHAQSVTDTPTPTPAARVNVGLGQFPVLGDTNAKVTIVEFADFQCPFCEQWYTQVEPNIINDYVKTGKAKFAFRIYAFLGPDSNSAAEGAYCANEQGKFWAYHNFLYSHQGQENSGQFSKANLE